MPSNVSVEYSRAQQKYAEARTNAEKLAALQGMWSVAPSHKGAENLRAEITRKMAALRKLIEKEKAQSKKKGSAPSMHVKKEGCAQVVLVGLPNSGKSSLLNSLTGINAAVAPYPFTTIKPEIGMMNFKGALVQLVEVPAIIEGSAGGRAQGTQLFSVIRNADAIILVVRNPDEEKILLNELGKAGIKANKKRPAIQVRPAEFKGITIAGKRFLKMPEAEFIEFLKGLGIHSASVLLNEPTTTEKVLETLDDSLVYRKALTVNPFIEKDIPLLKEKIFALLERILVYTKKPGKDADMNEPLALKKGSTVESVAKLLHKDFAQNLRYVKLWGSGKFPAQRVAKNYRLKGGDIIEIYS
ncbi:MAG: GTPase [Candidatus Diapherotrites archaeon]